MVLIDFLKKVWTIVRGFDQFLNKTWLSFMVLINFFEKAWTIVHGFDEQAWTIVHGFDQFFEK